jgi:heme exporter protein CcmD
MSNYVAAAYGLTLLFLGGYALSVIWRRRTVERDLAELDDEVA